MSERYDEITVEIVKRCREVAARVVASPSRNTAEDAADAIEMLAKMVETMHASFRGLSTMTAPHKGKERDT